MKVVLTLLAITILWLNAIAGDFISMKQKEPLTQRTAGAWNTNIIRTDLISDYSINDNSRLNSVQISSDNPLGKSLDADQKGMKNSVEIDGEGNWVNIQQNWNQVNICQTNQNSLK